MRLLSVNVGRPREVLAEGHPVLTGIFKHPVDGRVAVRRENLDGDGQADLRVHGGPDKAVYAYPAEHYGFWRGELSMGDLPFGMFGENLTLEGLREEELHLGDRFAIGSAELEVAQPRVPCFKLGLRFGRPDMVKRFLESRRSGFYLRVVREGEVGAGDPVVPTRRCPGQATVAEVTRLYAFDREDAELLRRVVESPALPEGWRAWFLERAEKQRL